MASMALNYHCVGGKGIWLSCRPVLITHCNKEEMIFIVLDQRDYTSAANIYYIPLIGYF